MSEIIAAADGSALGNPGPAGWAWYIDDNHWAAGGWEHGTNNMGELKAVLDLFEATAHMPERKLVVYCDSQYVINSLTKWMPGWKSRGWKKADGKPVLNRELLQELDAATAGRDYQLVWVKGAQTPPRRRTSRGTHRIPARALVRLLGHLQGPPAGRLRLRRPSLSRAPQQMRI